MTITDCHITTGTDDWYKYVGSSPVTGTTLLIATYNNATTPSSESGQYYEIDTSSIPSTDIISSAVLYVYGHNYFASKFVTKEFRMYILEGGTSLIANKTYTTAKWYNAALSSAQISNLNLSGKTSFYISVANPGTGKYRTFNARAYEYTGSYSAYLRVTHTAPAKKKHLLRLGPQTLPRFYKCRQL